MVKLGGPRSVTDAVKASGGQVGPRTKWLGAWCLKHGTADWPAYFEACKLEGVQPLIFWWAWGDDISPSAIRSGVQDRYQNVWKNRANLLPILHDVMGKARAAGVRPIVAIENEFNKNGCHASPEFANWFDECAFIIKNAGGQVLFAPGAWGDLTALCAYYKRQVDASDMVGLQCGYFAPRRRDPLDKVGAVMQEHFSKLPAGKPRILYDTFLSTYGGNFQATHPFIGGDGRALEAQQAAAITALGQIPDLEAVIYRDLKDNPTFDVRNYGGHAERFVGVIRSDGTKKPAHDALLAIAAPPPKTRTEAEYQQVVKELEHATRLLTDETSKTRTLTSLLEEARIESQSHRARLDAIREAGGWTQNTAWPRQ